MTDLYRLLAVTAFLLAFAFVAATIAFGHDGPHHCHIERCH